MEWPHPVLGVQKLLETACTTVTYAPMLSVFLAVSALLVGLQGVAGGVIMLTIFRALGFGVSTGLSPITNAYVAENVQPKIRGLAMGVLQCGYPLGWYLASMFAVPLLAAYGWRVMCFAAFLVIPVAGLFHWMLRDAPDVRIDASTPRETGGIRPLFAHPK